MYVKKYSCNKTERWNQDIMSETGLARAACRSPGPFYTRSVRTHLNLIPIFHPGGGVGFYRLHLHGDPSNGIRTGPNVAAATIDAAREPGGGVGHNTCTCRSSSVMQSSLSVAAALH